MKRIFIILAIAAVLAGAAWGGIAWLARPEPLYYITIDQGWRYQDPGGVFATDYETDGDWLTYRELDGVETRINVNSRNVLIVSEHRHETISEAQRKAAVGGEGGF